MFRVNGPAGIAAAAFGTLNIPKVVKVLGPGSPPVVCAQLEVQRYGCSSVMLLGPTESLVVADDSADPRLLAADLLIEAEHGDDSSVVLVTPGRDARRRHATGSWPRSWRRCPNLGVITPPSRARRK